MLPSDLPADRTMTSLEMLSSGYPLAPDGDNLRVTFPAGGGFWEVTNDEMQELEARGWLDLSVDEHYTVTERGVYWLKKWNKEKNGRVMVTGPATLSEISTRLIIAASLGARSDRGG